MFPKLLLQSGVKWKAMHGAVGEGEVHSKLFCIFNHCYFISCPNTAQNLSHNKATPYIQYHAKTWQQRPLEKILQSI